MNEMFKNETMIRISFIGMIFTQTSMLYSLFESRKISYLEALSGYESIISNLKMLKSTYSDQSGYIGVIDDLIYELDLRYETYTRFSILQVFFMDRRTLTRSIVYNHMMNIKNFYPGIF